MKQFKGIIIPLTVFDLEPCLYAARRLLGTFSVSILYLPFLYHQQKQGLFNLKLLFDNSLQMTEMTLDCGRLDDLSHVYEITTVQFKLQHLLK